MNDDTRQITDRPDHASSPKRASSDTEAGDGVRVETGESSPEQRLAAPRPSKGFILLLILISTTSPLGINLYLPSLPAMSRDLQVDFVAIQFTLSLYLGGVALGQLFMGPLSDRFGRRPVLLVGLLLFALGSVMCMLAPNAGTLYLGRLVQALGGSAGIALGRAIVRDLFGRELAASMLGYVTMGVSLAPMLAPTVGGLLETFWGWRAAFAFLAAIGLTVFALSLMRLPETNQRLGSTQRRPPLADYAALMRSRAYWSFTLTNALTSCAFYSFIASASYVMIDILGRGPVEYGLYSALISTGYIAGNFVSGRFAVRVGIARLVSLGTIITIFAVGAMAVLFASGVHHPLALFAPVMFLTLGNGLIIPCCIAGAISVKPEAAGAASGLIGSTQIGAGAIVAPLVGAMLTDSVWPLIAVMGISTVLSFITFRLRPTSTLSTRSL